MPEKALRTADRFLVFGAPAIEDAEIPESWPACAAAGLLPIEEGAHAIETPYKGRKAGTFGFFVQDCLENPSCD